MNRIINDLVDIVHLRVGRPLELRRATVDLVALTAQVAEDHRVLGREHTIQVESAGPVVGEWDAVRLERVLGNLLNNAIKYSPKGGTVTLDVRREELEQGAVAALRVQDQGLGIPEAEIGRVFERFYRGSNVGAIAGTGIGLAGARQIVEQHGGTIRVESRAGEGTTFTVRLPLDSPSG